MNEKKDGYRNAPLYLTTIAHCDLTEIPIRIVLETPSILYESLISKRIETEKVIVIFERGKK